MPCRLQNDQPLKCCDEGFNNMRLAAILRLNMRDMPVTKTFTSAVISIRVALRISMVS